MSVALRASARADGMIWGSFRYVPIVQRPRTRPFQGQDPGSNPGGDANHFGSIPETWVTPYSGDMGDSLGANGLSIVSSRALPQPLITL